MGDDSDTTEVPLSVADEVRIDELFAFLEQGLLEATSEEGATETARYVLDELKTLDVLSHSFDVTGFIEEMMIGREFTNPAVTMNTTLQHEDCLVVGSFWNASEVWYSVPLKDGLFKARGFIPLIFMMAAFMIVGRFLTSDIGMILSLMVATPLAIISLFTAIPFFIDMMVKASIHRLSELSLEHFPYQQRKAVCIGEYEIIGVQSSPHFVNGSISVFGNESRKTFESLQMKGILGNLSLNEDMTTLHHWYIGMEKYKGLIISTSESDYLFGRADAVGVEG